jgi:hypothetical protein
MPRALRWLVGTVWLIAGCSMFQGEKAEWTPVADEDYGRLTPAQLGPVDAARAQLHVAGDEVARSKLRISEAQNEVDMARADQDAAAASQEHAAVQAHTAKSSNDPNAKAQAQESAAAAELQSRSAQAHLAYANQLVKARQKELDAANEQVKMREAELDRSKLTALSEAGLPAANKYDPSLFDARVAGARKDFYQAQANARKQLTGAQHAEDSWRTLHSQYQARVQAAPSTGAATSGTASSGTGAGPQPAPAPAQAPTQNPPPPPATNAKSK